MSQHPPTPREAGSDSAPEIITDLNFQLLPKILGTRPGPEVIRQAGHSGAEHFLRTVTLSDLLRFDRRAVMQLIWMRDSLPLYISSPLSAGKMLHDFEGEFYQQRMKSVRFHNIETNAVLIWHPTKELVRWLLLKESSMRGSVADLHLPDFTEMQGMRLIGCDQPGISVAWLPSLHTELQ